MDCRVEPGNDDDGDVDGRDEPGHDEKLVHDCFVEAVNLRKNP
jgi:hypothetical protein